MSHNRIYNFSAGPSMLPESVLERAAAEMLNYNNSGMSVMEMSHRSKIYDEIIVSVEAKLRRAMGIPDNYKVLLLQGGATTQFAALPMNLLQRTADYIVTGQFSGKAYEEAQKYGDAKLAGTSKDAKFSYIPSQQQLTLNSEADYVHICQNNTMFGSRWPYLPDTGSVPLVADVSSMILSEPVDVGRYGVLYAGAQKNMAPAGLTVVIVRDDLLSRPKQPYVPAMLDWAYLAENNSMPNTPPCYCIYMLGLVLDWIESIGGISAMAEHNRYKAGLLYDCLDASSLFSLPVRPDCRSLMNVTFFTGDEALDKRFCSEAAAAGLVSLSGHRLVGGMRASIYNAMPVEGVEALVRFIKEFEAHV